MLVATVSRMSEFEVAVNDAAMSALSASEQ